ncbi:3'-5' exoribonuclease exoribonuclease [Acrasis kona]|uniref:3'-5' exoribonuclease exoribonuclease n=1 Tax=Acrasis kona TaxID=1008807 RepID=A0AAW2Z719_9EUKA
MVVQFSDDSISRAACNSLKKHLFDYLIIIDFEATCDNGPKPLINRDNQEMIEFPFVVVELLDEGQNCRITHKQQHYVMPENFPELTDFCTKLTGITSDILKEKGKPLSSIIALFDKFIEQEMKDKKFCIITDGEWDLKQLLLRESKNKNITLQKHYYQFFDLRKEFKKCFPQAHVRGLASMVELTGCTFSGRHHSGIDDCMTVKLLIDELLKQNHKFEDVCSIDPFYDPFRDASFCEFKNPSRSRVYTPPVYFYQYYQQTGSNPYYYNHHPIPTTPKEQQQQQQQQQQPYHITYPPIQQQLKHKRRPPKKKTFKVLSRKVEVNKF